LARTPDTKESPMVFRNNKSTISTSTIIASSPLPYRHRMVLNYPSMPLVKVFARIGMTKPIPLALLQSKLCAIWSTKPDTTKLILLRSEDWTSDSFDEDCYVDIRAYGKAERTREFVLDGMKQVQKAFAEENLVANVRLETYDGERYFHVPPPKAST